MSQDHEVPQQWVLDLQQGVMNMLSAEYKFKASWAYDSDNLYLTFPDVPLDKQDLTQGINRAMSRYGGYATKEHIYFPKPTQKQATPVPIQTVKPVSQSPILSSDNNNYEKNVLSSEVKNNMSMTMEKYLESNSNFVSLKNCKVGDTFTIMEKPQFIESEFEGKKRVQLVATVLKENPNGENIDMKMSINKTNAQTLVDNWGSDLSPWVGRKVFIATKQKYNNGKEGFIIVPKQ